MTENVYQTILAKHGLSISVRLNVFKTEDILVFSHKEYIKVVGY